MSLTFLTLGAIWIAGCSDTYVKPFPHTPTGTYTITVNGVSGASTHTTPLTLTVK